MADAFPSPDGETSKTVSFNGLHYEMFLDAGFNDPISQVFASGQFWMRHLADLMLCLVKPGDFVVDLGAHLGTMALPAAVAGCHVLAVEAAQRNAQLLQRSVDYNHFSQMRVMHAAVGSAPGLAEFCAHGPWGHVYSDVTKMPSVSTRVATVDAMLKELGWPRVDFMKIDVEGSEIAALRGMPDLLGKEGAPAILYESNSCGLMYYNQTVTELKAELEKFGYANYLVEPNHVLRPVHVEDVQPEHTVDYLAVKRPPAGLRGWRIAKTLSRKELLTRVLHSVKTPDANQIAHLRRLIPSSWLADESAMQRIAFDLESDRIQPVPPRAARLGWLRRWLRRTA